MSVEVESRPVTRHRVTAAEVTSTAARLTLAAVFLAAGALKVVDPGSSVEAVRAYELLPEGVATLVGWGLPFAEIALGLILALGAFTRTAAVAAAGLLAAFMAAVVSAWVRGLSIDCGCFGGGGPVAPGETAYVTELLRDTALLALAGWLAWRPASRWALDRPASGEL